MRESKYWLLIIEGIHKCDDSQQVELDFLMKESTELKNILGSIANKTKK